MGDHNSKIKIHPSYCICTVTVVKGVQLRQAMTANKSIWFNSVAFAFDNL